MTPQDRSRVKALVAAALQRDPEERGTFLDAACGDRPDLRAEAASYLDAETTAAYVAALDDSTGSLTGRTIGSYIVRQEIGRGGMGVVYLADDTRLSRRVALKVLPRHAARDTNRRERLRSEARAAAALGHPGVATVYALEEIGDDLILVCEYVPGQTLRAVLESGSLSAAQIADISTQLGRALAAAHGYGIVHRDLKPENVMRTPSGVVKILDFGLARAENLTPTRLTETGTVVGTPAYMSPEQVRGQDVDFRSDLFSFGVLLFEMACGTNPFDAGTTPATIARILEVEPPAVSAVSSSALRGLDGIVATCLRKQAAERYQSTNELVVDLERLQEQALDSRDRPPAADRSGLKPRWWWECHQVVVAAVYALMIYPAWRVRPWIAEPWGLGFFFVVLACASAAVTLRLHLLFASRVLAPELPAQRSRAVNWKRTSDAGFAAALLLGAFAIGGAHPEVATLLVTVAVAATVASFVIEPATTRAAFAATEPRAGSRGPRASSRV